ncbi:hypothetical protein Barb6_01518 [Bacteroidales bacterium Barb6]|nr:hypothetical protein Barb6_01518 [Bacteroidales bacterium Barb6]
MDSEKWGFLRETIEDAKKAGIDEDTGLHRTGLEEYLKVIFPKVDDWIHDKRCSEWKRKVRPDYRSESLKLIIEFDGLQHYTKVDKILDDIEKTKFYKELGYKVVRIPYFIQLTNKVAETLFGVKVNEQLFNESIPSLGIKGRNSPANLCPAGVKRMAEEFAKFPEQYKINVEFLKQQNDTLRSGVEYLEKEYNKLIMNYE